MAPEKRLGLAPLGDAGPTTTLASVGFTRSRQQSAGQEPGGNKHAEKHTPASCNTRCQPSNCRQIHPENRHRSRQLFLHGINTARPIASSAPCGFVSGARSLDDDLRSAWRNFEELTPVERHGSFQIERKSVVARSDPDAAHNSASNGSAIARIRFMVSALYWARRTNNTSCSSSISGSR